MKEVFVTALLLGLSTGIYCLTYCIPFVAPLLVSENRGRSEALSIVLKFILGRFVGYMVFGAAVSFLGGKLNDGGINIGVSLSLILLSILLILHAAGLLKPNKFSFCLRFKKFYLTLPFVMGFLMGINICPPFLMSLAYVFTLHDFGRGMIYFLMFFLGTSIYFLPAFFLGILSKFKEYQFIGRISALIVGMLFFCYGFYSILKGVDVFHLWDLAK